MSQEIYNVLIIGCGNIAGGFDTGSNVEQLPCTHAGAYVRHNSFNIVACIDINEVALEAFKRAWGIKLGFTSIDEFKASGIQVDLISVCSPTDFHNKHVLDAIEIKPRMIFCEKPVTNSALQTLSIISRCKSDSILLAVNYTRRWDPEVMGLKYLIDSNQLGDIRSIVGYYNKGILNNGSHMIDLLFYLFDELSIIATAPEILDGVNNDSTIPALLQTNNNISIHLVAADSKDYTLFELQFITSNGILTMHEGGLTWSRRGVKNSERFKGYKNLDEGVFYPGSYDQAMSGAIENLYQALENDEKLLCTGQDAYKAQVLCEALSAGKTL